MMCDYPARYMVKRVLYDYVSTFINPLTGKMANELKKGGKKMYRAVGRLGGCGGF